LEGEAFLEYEENEEDLEVEESCLDPGESLELSPHLELGAFMGSLELGAWILSVPPSLGRPLEWGLSGPSEEALFERFLVVVA